MTLPIPNQPSSSTSADDSSQSSKAAALNALNMQCATGTAAGGAFGFGVCPVCSGALFEIRGKLQCRVCHTICETCCEGGRQ